MDALIQALRERYGAPDLRLLSLQMSERKLNALCEEFDVDKRTVAGAASTLLHEIHKLRLLKRAGRKRLHIVR